ncbi:uncharacterized protein AMSG_06072 [Thecamonas trahens ATCC 50062]|uniref:CCHC-type domain-containing protein n=1 Tax=Thecamonas trahens ATCC 50062 TaxID=461836 RepID=A0A0L0DBS2_THETB|nr:hypothetical protein AMSG_06072 [Thecamonas trahens ATCC 50062]KNC49794.1 hypothetical protein AMSG_06072 [Thecamonas trahens ATCC 50062]|eukprot:XP_013757578.1 hypothetical protein AMSG_06072 [Thecamonas trahens ATCC 50062]
MTQVRRKGKEKSKRRGGGGGGGGRGGGSRTCYRCGSAAHQVSQCPELHPELAQSGDEEGDEANKYRRRGKGDGNAFRFEAMEEALRREAVESVDVLEVVETREEAVERAELIGLSAVGQALDVPDELLTKAVAADDVDWSLYTDKDAATLAVEALPDDNRDLEGPSKPDRPAPAGTSLRKQADRLAQLDGRAPIVSATISLDDGALPGIAAADDGDVDALLASSAARTAPSTTGSGKVQLAPTATATPAPADAVAAAVDATTEDLEDWLDDVI